MSIYRHRLLQVIPLYTVGVTEYFTRNNQQFLVVNHINVVHLDDFTNSKENSTR